MFSVSSLRRLATGALLVAGMGVFGTSPARASEYCPTTCHYKCVTVYVPKTVYYTKLVTLYDECGRPYQVERTCATTIQVPVTIRVPVCD
jgi:hypothetical protein